MDRLDSVCGQDKWSNRYEQGPNGGVICGISIKTDNEWLTKYDGAENTNVEAVKGGLSGSMKRAAVQWGIGRYLYKLEQYYAQDVSLKKYKGATYQAANKGKNIPAFYWSPPKLPMWALPKITKEKKELIKELYRLSDNAVNATPVHKSFVANAESKPIEEIKKAIKAFEGMQPETNQG
jgi:hypothetical protein